MEVGTIFDLSTEAYFQDVQVFLRFLKEYFVETSPTTEDLKALLNDEATQNHTFEENVATLSGICVYPVKSCGVGLAR